MPFAKAGRYHEVLFVNQRIAPNTDATITDTTGTPAVLYSDRTKTTPLSSAVVRSDSAGNLGFFADPGYYNIQVSGVIVQNITVPLDYDISADFQPIDSDLTAIAALATTTFGRAFLTQADAAASRTYIDAASNSDSRFTQIVHNTQTGSYTLVLADAGKLIEMNVAGANTLTVPPNSSVAFPVGTVIGWRQYGAGQVTLTQGAGVTIRSSGGKLKSGAQYAEGTLTKRATDEWVASGDLVV